MNLVISTFVRRITEDLFEVKAILMSLSINVLHCGVMMFFSLARLFMPMNLRVSAENSRALYQFIATLST